MQSVLFVMVLGLIASVAKYGSCELFSSMEHLQRALYAERDIGVVLNSYIRMEEERLRKLKQIADDFETHSANAMENPSFYIANPVNAFLFVKRFTTDWEDNVDPLIKNSTGDEMRRYIVHYRQDLPTYEDLTGAATALMRLQDTYKLDTRKIAHGDLGGTASSSLTVNDCYELGKLCYNTDDYVHTSLWMGEVLDRLDEAPDARVNSSIDKIQVLDYIAFSEYMKGNIKTALTYTEELLTLDPNHERAENNIRYYEKMLAEQEENKKPIIDKVERTEHEYRQTEEFQNYEALCRGEEIMKVADADKMVCRYRTWNNPLLILSPVAEEEVSLDPRIYIYHNVMSESEMEGIKNIATPLLNRATVQNAKTGALETATYRVSKSAWLKEDAFPLIERINRRIGAITGLNMDTAEELQIANYGLGGHYEPHFDFARKEEKDAFKSLGTGNRIATFLFYMSDVEAGGATVFPYIGVKLFPIKGAAAFWYNLYRSGEGIYSTRHAGCPVLVGNKWVSNKWIHERGQEFTRPCSLTDKE